MEVGILSLLSFIISASLPGKPVVALSLLLGPTLTSFGLEDLARIRDEG